MGIKIDKLPKDQVFDILGHGDWYLTLPTSEPDLLLTQQLREQLVELVSSWYVRWVIKGIQIDIVHDNDPPWDCSGSARSYPIDSLLLLIRYPTLEAWFTEEYTGENRASYESGMGFFWNTYGDNLEEAIQDALYHLLKDYWLKVRNLPDDFDFPEDSLWDDLCYFRVELEQLLLHYLGRATTADTWKQYEPIVHAQLEAERQQSEIRQARYQLLNEMVQQFWHQHFSHLIGKRIEVPQFEEMGIGKMLMEILADTDPTTVEAIAELGLPGNFSNGVSETIKRIAREVAGSFESHLK